MINIPPIKQSSSIKAELIPELTRTWKVGQVLNATTQRGGEALSKVLIQVGQHTLETKTPVTLQTGQQIKLLVKSLSTLPADNSTIKLPLLSIIEAAPATTQSNQQAATKLRQFIAVIQSFSQLQQTTSQVLSNELSLDRLPVALKNQLNNLQQNIQINPGNVTTAQLKQTILNSGIFLESKLHSFKTENITIDKHLKNLDSSLNRDFKFQLLAIKPELSQLIPVKHHTPLQPLTQQQVQQIETLITQTANTTSESKINLLSDKLLTLLPKDSLIQLSNLLSVQKTSIPATQDIQVIAKLLTQIFHGKNNIVINQLQEQMKFRLLLLDLSQQVEQSISKITSLQLQPLSREGDNLVLLLFNLVFKDRHEQFDINFSIQQNNNEKHEEDENWTVILDFTFKTLGKVQSKIHLTGNQISNTFYTELASTAEKIKQLLPLLETGLTKAGLNILSLDVINSLMNKHSFIGPQVHLLDEKA